MARILGRVRLSRVTDESTSVVRQRQEIEAWAKAHGHKIVGWAEDLDFSRSVEPFKAPKLRPWLTDPLKIDSWDLMVSWRVDRLGAGWKLLPLMSWLLERGKDLACTTQAFNLQDPMGQNVFFMYAQNAQAEWDATRERVTNTRTYLRTVARWAGGLPPYWLKPKRKGAGFTLVLDPISAEVTKRIIHEYLSRRPINAICSDLTKEHVPTPVDYYRIRAEAESDAAEIEYRGKTSEGRAWRNGTITKMLANPGLMGHLTHENLTVYDENGEPLQASEPLISADQFERIQTETERRTARKAPRREAGTGLLLGVLACGECSGPAYLNVQTNRKPGRPERIYRYYRFPCGHVKRTNADDMEDAVQHLFMLVLGKAPRLEPFYIPGEDHTAELAQAEAGHLELSTRLATAPTENIRRGLTTRLDTLEKRIRVLAGLPVTAARMEYRPTGETYQEAWDRMNDLERRELMNEAGYVAKYWPGPDGGYLAELPEDLRERLHLATGDPIETGALLSFDTGPWLLGRRIDSRP